MALDTLRCNHLEPLGFKGLKMLGYTRMALSTLKCNHLTPLHFKGLNIVE